MKITVESTGNGIWIGINGQRHCFATTDIAKLQEIFQTALAHQGLWELTPKEFKQAPLPADKPA